MTRAVSMGTLVGLVLTAATYAASNDRPKATIVLDITAQASTLSLAELERELSSIPDLGYKLTWIRSSDIEAGQDLTRPVHVKLRGQCNMLGVAPDIHSPGPFAWAHVSDGRVLPYIEVDCERIRGALFSVMWGEDFQHRDFLFGRALARVLAHELHHVLAGESSHERHGLARPQLSAASLIRGDARLFADFAAQ